MKEAPAVTRTVDNLVRDLLLLYIRYGADKFDAALSELRTGHLANRISDLSSEIVTVGGDLARRKSGLSEHKSASKKRTPKESFREYVKELKDAGADKELAVANFIEDISVGTFLPTARSLKYYLSMLGLSVNNVKLDRLKAAREIAAHLLQIPLEEARQKIESGREISAERSTLQGWSNIIVKRRE